MKEFILGLGAIVVALVVLAVMSVLVTVVFYWFGWSMGYAFEYLVGPIVFGGLKTTELFGLMIVFASMIGGTVTVGVANNIKTVEKNVLSKFKEYRGY